MKNLFKNMHSRSIVLKSPLVSCIMGVSFILVTTILIQHHQLSHMYKRIYTFKQYYDIHQERLKKDQMQTKQKDRTDLPRLSHDPAYVKNKAAEFYKAQKVHTVIESVVDADATSEAPSVITSPKAKSKNSYTQKKKSYHPLKGYFKSPIAKNLFWLSSRFGPRKKPNGSWGFHYGIDMAALKGTEIQAAADGVIEQAGYISGFGNMILVRHRMKGYKTRYAHLQKILVKKGQLVKRGERIGTVGDTGFTIKNGKDASHLHFEILEKGRQINPLHLIG